ncbi:MAG TPA: hypothetical protein VIQ00_03160 [Chitinophagaceae bacterium]
MVRLSLMIMSLTLLIMYSGCKSDQRYIDLASGEHINIEKDSTTGYMVNADSRKPVNIYVDTKTKDTLYGRTGEVVNGKVKKNGEKWEYEDDEFTYKEGDYKLKVESDGDYKIKDGDYKKKVENDGDVKIKDGDKKVKIDGETGEKKVKDD